MEVPKATDEDKARFKALIPDAPGVEVRAMFGNVGAFVNGNMFAGLFGSSLGVKLVEKSSLEELSAVPGTGPFGPDGRPMGGYVALPDTWATSSRTTTTWIDRALREVGTLPAKASKKAKAKAK
ncbi:MAG: TfoX/Sxy family protein [Candidatus Nanopelagicales bacterium]